MIIKIFKISTKEMWTFYGKNALRKYIMTNILCAPKSNATINELMQYLPREEYYVSAK